MVSSPRPLILVTRPLSAAQRLASRLEREGFDAAIEPLLILHPRFTPLPDLEGIGALAFTSAHALDALEPLPPLPKDFFGLPCLAVGAHTARRVRAAGFHDVIEGDRDGAHLGAIAAARFGPNAILHIRGMHHDVGFEREVLRQGGLVRAWEVYEASASHALSPACTDLLKGDRLRGVTLHSVRSAQIFASLLRSAHLEACCARLTAIGLSLAVLEPLDLFPWRARVPSLEPSEDALIECLKQTFL